MKYLLRQCKSKVKCKSDDIPLLDSLGHYVNSDPIITISFSIHLFCNSDLPFTGLMLKQAEEYVFR